MENQTPFVRAYSSELSMFEENLILIVCRFVLGERGKAYGKKQHNYQTMAFG